MSAGPAPRVPVRPEILVVASILSVQVGAAVAKGLFDRVSPDLMVWLRLATSTLVLLAIARPRLRGRTRRAWLLAVGYGLTLGGMNWAIYHAFSRIPLGLAVTIEFLGPLAVAVLGSRQWQHLVWAALAGVGVVLLGFSPVRPDPVGVAFALLAGVCWGGYILLAGAVGRSWSGVSGLAVASTVAMLAASVPMLATGGLGDLVDPTVIALGAGVGLLSSVIPYSLEMHALRTMPSRVFGVLMSLEPAVAALMALLLLGERLRPVEWVAVLCVVAASVGSTRAGLTPAADEIIAGEDVAPTEGEERPCS